MSKTTKVFIMRSKTTHDIFGVTASENSRDCFKRFLFMEGNGDLREKVWELIAADYEMVTADLTSVEEMK